VLLYRRIGLRRDARRKGLLLWLRRPAALRRDAIEHRRNGRWLIVAWWRWTYSRRNNRFVGESRCNCRTSTNRWRPRGMGDRETPGERLLLLSSIEGRLLWIKSLL
jgi:hypothetical protein